MARGGIQSSGGDTVALGDDPLKGYGMMTMKCPPAGPVRVSLQRLHRGGGVFHPVHSHQWVVCRTGPPEREPLHHRCVPAAREREEDPSVFTWLLETPSNDACWGLYSILPDSFLSVLSSSETYTAPSIILCFPDRNLLP